MELNRAQNAKNNQSIKDMLIGEQKIDIHQHHLCLAIANGYKV
jgi:hypothetical protein